jgi:hypothetical protein
MGPLGQPPYFEEESKPHRPMLAPRLVTWLCVAEHAPAPPPWEPGGWDPSSRRESDSARLGGGRPRAHYSRAKGTSCSLNESTFSVQCFKFIGVSNT